MIIIIDFSENELVLEQISPVRSVLRSQVTSYTERSQVPEKLMDGTYVEGLCAWV